MSQRIPTHRKMLKSALFDRRSFFLLELLITMTFQSFEAQLTQETKVASFFRGRPDPTASLSASLLHSRSCDRTEVKKVNDLKAGVQYTNLGYLPFSPFFLYL